MRWGSNRKRRDQPADDDDDGLGYIHTRIHTQCAFALLAFGIGGELVG